MTERCTDFDALLNQHLIEINIPIVVPTDRHRLLELVRQGWQSCYAEWFGQKFVDALAPHHIEAVEWHWDSRINRLEGRKPEYLAYFPIWSRGHLKSSLAERMVVVDAMLSYAYDQPGYALYVAKSKDKVETHIANIEKLLSEESIRRWNPKLSNPQKSTTTNQQKKWTSTFLKAESGYSIQGGSLDSGLAGSRVDETRPTYMTLDDIDGREDSPLIAESRMKQLTTEILPMRQEDTLVFFAQNLISRQSTMYRIYEGHSRVLTNRKPSFPIPAVTNLVTEVRNVNGIIKDVYVSGESTWHVWDDQRIQDEIDTEGLESFLRECQHEVKQSRSGMFHKCYNDTVHAISESEFASIYGVDAWKDWRKVAFSDWARTKTRYHANVAGYLAVSSQNTPLPGMTFCIPVSFPAETMPADVAERLLSLLTPYAYKDVTWRQLMDEAWKRANAQQYFNSVSDRLEYERSYYSQLIPQYSRKVLGQYMVQSAVNSHSEDKVRELFNSGFGFNFQPSNPGKTEALEDIDEAMRVDYAEPHVFKLGVMGYTRWYVICPDNKMAESQVIDGVEVFPPVPYPENLASDNLHDSDLFRYQMCNRRFAEPKMSEWGERVDEPLKLDDDFGQGLQMVYFKRLLSNIALTAVEKFEIDLQRKGLTQHDISAAPETQQLGLIQARAIEERAFANSKRKNVDYRRMGVKNFYRK